MNRPKAAFFLNHKRHLDYVYREPQSAAVVERCELYPTVISQSNFGEHLEGLQDLEYIFSTWSMPDLSEEEIRKLPELKAVFYAAGSVQGFARPFLKCGVKIFSAWAANAIPVAEFSLAQILLSCKGYFRNTRGCDTWEERTGGQLHSGLGIYNNKVALIGFGMIGRKLADLLRPFHMDVMVVDPYVTDEVLTAHNCRRATLEEAFETAYVVSNHLPNLPATKGMLNGDLFAKMRSDATFINTGRGAQVVEADLIQVLSERPDLTALLDVTYPEPPEKGSEFYTLPNVHLSSHIAGSINQEVVRMADYMIAEYDRLRQGEETLYEVTETLLQTMA
ncbi:MAG: hydroxyacid dehydrogenase [Verrucomicrobia bacterium]|nr:hydroxyacid dehydrogenase [Verrucomicrobiota bacterium]MCH8527961.1 hydroxyacid dehydrogenase [Kiritimatiellia bacterium]